MVCLAALLDELRRIEGGEVRIAVDVGVHLGELEAIGVGKQLGVELGPADHEQRRRPADGGDRGRGVGEAFGAFGAELRVAAYDEVASSGQRTAERLPGLASHQDGVAERERTEMLQVGPEPPRQLVVASDGAVARDRGDEDDLGSIHTATGALMCGCGS